MADATRESLEDVARAFLAESARQLAEDHLPRVERCLELLTNEEIWWRPRDECNSVGNLLLHMAGNLRQWVVSGVGGEKDIRVRQAEFDERGPLAPGAPLEMLRGAVTDARRVLESTQPADLLRVRRVQGREVTGLCAIYHAVEHFSMHTGQIIMLTKQLKGDLQFYEFRDGVPTARWHKSRSG